MISGKGNFSSKKLVIIILIMAVPCYFIARWTDNNLEFWLSYFKGIYTPVNNWLSLILTVVLNAFAVLANIISEICKLLV